MAVPKRKTAKSKTKMRRIRLEEREGVQGFSLKKLLLQKVRIL